MTNLSPLEPEEISITRKLNNGLNKLHKHQFNRFSLWLQTCRANTEIKNKQKSHTLHSQAAAQHSNSENKYIKNMCKSTTYTDDEHQHKRSTVQSPCWVRRDWWITDLFISEKESVSQLHVWRAKVVVFWFFLFHRGATTQIGREEVKYKRTKEHALSTKYKCL